MFIISERHRCGRVAARGGDESAVLSCYYIKVRCLFKFTAPAAGAHYSSMYAGWWQPRPAAWLPCEAGEEARWHSLLWIATRLPCRKLCLGCVGGGELECLSSSLPELHLPLSTGSYWASCRASPPALLSLSTSQSYRCTVSAATPNASLYLKKF